MSAALPTGLMTPVSLLAAITDTTSMESDIMFSRDTMSSVPFLNTGMVANEDPSSCRMRHVWMTDLCSVAPARTLIGLPMPLCMPASARLLASVAPDVNMTSCVSMPTASATFPRASSMIRAAVLPCSWCTLDGLPKFSANSGIMASITRPSTGVVAL